MHGRVYGAAILMTLALTGASAAEAPNTGHGRYTMSPVDGGFLRLDTETGAVAMCAQSSGGWACNAVADHTDNSSPSELSRLKDENIALKERVKELEESLETGNAAPPPGTPPLAEGPPGGKVQLPTEQEVDQALDYLEHVYKKIRDRIKNLDRPPSPPADDSKPDAEDEAPPHKDSL